MGKRADGLFIKTGADFSACRTWRYRLWRIWNTARPPVLFIMLNPSTADETENDHTVERCQRYAAAWGYGGLYVCNLFAYCSKDRSVLGRVPDPVGPQNDAAILAAVAKVRLVVCAWGVDGLVQGRDQKVIDLLLRHKVRLHCLRLIKRGIPGHPLYLPKALKPLPWTPGGRV